MDFLVDDNDSQEVADHDDSQSNDSQGVSDDDSQYDDFQGCRLHTMEFLVDENDFQGVADDDSQSDDSRMADYKIYRWIFKTDDDDDKNLSITSAISMCDKMLKMDLSVTLANRIKVFKSELQLADISLYESSYYTSVDEPLDEHIRSTWDVHIRNWVNHVEKYLQFEPIRDGRMHDELFERKLSILLQSIDDFPIVDNIYKCLEELENHGEFENYQIQKLKLELRNLRVHFKWRAYSFDEASYYHHMSMKLRSWVRYVKKCPFLQLTERLEETLSNLLHIMMETKMEFSKENCRWIDELPFNFDYPNALITDLLEWIDQLLDNVKHLIQWNGLSSVISIKEHNETWAEKVGFLRNILQIAGMELEEVIKNGKQMPGMLHKTSENLSTRIKMLIYKATYVSWYILDDSKHQSMEKFHQSVEKFFLVSLANIDHIEPEIRMTCVQLLKGSKIANPRTLGIDLQALAAVDSLLDNLQKLLKDKDNGSFMHLDVCEIEILCQKLCFLKYFLMDPYMKQHNEIEAQSFMSLLKQVEEVARELGASLTKDHFPIEIHANLLKILNLLKNKIREIYFSIPRQSTSNFPRSPKLGFVNFFIQSLEELLQQRADSIAYVKNEVKTLQKELTSFIRNSIEKFEKNENIASDIVNVAYEAEHVIDLISASHFPKWYYILWLSDITEKIKKLREDCQEVLKIACEISNMKIDSSTSNPNRAYNMATKEEIVGFHAEAERIIDQLTRGTQQLDIVSIVGMPGQGKTTLAKKVYEHPSITSHFHVRSWYCISQVYDRKDLLCTLCGRASKSNDEDQVLYRSLKGRRYLIVLDDIWSIEPWNDIQNSFPDDCNGSRILFTSRIRDIAMQANPNSALPHDLRLFSDEESWELLQNKVFKKRSCPPEIYPIGKKIAKNCNGLPLSVALVAGVLVKLEESEDHWKQVLASLGKQVGDLSKCVLELSYKQLPDHLKPCFLYFGVFPEDRKIPTWKLIRLWIAEGFIQKKTEHERLENVAEGYLMDLISRSLVLNAQSKSSGGIKSCHVHDLLHEFSMEKAKDENFFLISKEIPCDLWQYRHCFSYNWAFSSSIPYVRSVFFCPRSLFWVRILALSCDLKLLKVLNLQHIGNNQFQRLTEVLVHLRYLEIEGPLDHVPSSVANLWRLETLILSAKWDDYEECFRLGLPEALLEMAYLKHVYVNGQAFFNFCFDQSGKSIKSACIEKFSTLWLEDWTLKKVMRRLRNLRKLKCLIQQTQPNKFRLDMLSELESLDMEYDRDPERRNLLHEISFPSYLKKLTLKGHGFPWSEISKIKRLPQLKVLKLLSKSFTGQRWDANDDDEFWNLKYLKLEQLDIEEWDASPDVFPCLEKLVVNNCWNLKEIPSSFGESSTLQMIDVKWCRKTVTEVLEIEKDNMGAEFKVVIQDPLK